MTPIRLKEKSKPGTSSQDLDPSSNESIVYEIERLCSADRPVELAHFLLNNANETLFADSSVASAIKDACEFLGAAGMLAQPALLLIRAQSLYALRHYHEAYDTLRITRQISANEDEECSDLLARRIKLEIICLIALSDLYRAQQAWSDLECFFEDTDYFVNVETMLLGARLFLSAGKMTKSLAYANRALVCATNSPDEARAQAMIARINFRQGGDGARVIESLLPFSSAFEVNKAVGGKLARARDQIRLVLAPAFLSQGKIGSARKLLGEVARPRDVLSCELYLTYVMVSLCSGDFDLATRCVQDTMKINYYDGTARQERANILWQQALILLAIGHDREAQQRAEELCDLTATNNIGGLRLNAHFALASCCIQRGNIARAKELINRCSPDAIETEPGEDIQSYHTNSTLNAFDSALQSLILLAEDEREEAHEYLRGHADALLDDNALLTVALLCLSHESLFPLLCDALGVDALPTKLTDMLDYAPFQRSYDLARKSLSNDETIKLQRRFERGLARTLSSERRISPIDIKLFGGLEVSVGGVVLDLRSWRNSKARSLLVSLALEDGQDISREILIERFWPDQPLKQARNSFYVTWSAMRRRLLDALPHPQAHYREVLKSALVNAGGRCALRSQISKVDVREFTELSEKAMLCLQQDDEQGCLQAIRRLSYLYRGDLLPGDLYHDWLEAPRKRYQKQYTDAMVLAAELCLARSEPDVALYYLYRANACGCVGEELHHLAMRAYAQNGRREDAMNVFHECRTYLRDELGLDPTPGMRVFYEDLVRECA